MPQPDTQQCFFNAARKLFVSNGDHCVLLRHIVAMVQVFLASVEEVLRAFIEWILRFRDSVLVNRYFASFQIDMLVDFLVNGMEAS